MDIALIRSETEFLALREQWNTLVDASVYPNIFMTWDWQSIWWKWFGKKTDSSELFILTIKKDGELIGVVPFYRRRRQPPLFLGKHLNFIGFGGLTCPEYLGPIVRQGFIEEVADATVEFLKSNPSEWDSLFIEDYALDDPATVALAGRLSASFAGYSSEGESRLTIQFTGDYDAYMQTLSYNSRRQRRKRFNQAHARFGARIEYPKSEDLDNAFPTLVALTTQARDRHEQVNPFHDASYAGFHRELLEALLPKNRAVLALLHLNEKPAAIWYVFLLNEKCYAYQQGFLPEFESGSPSDVCQQFLIRRLTEEHFEDFDYARGRQAYKKSVANSERPTRWACVFRKPGLNFWLRRFIDLMLKPIARKVRNYLRTRILKK